MEKNGKIITNLSHRVSVRIEELINNKMIDK